VQRGVGTVAVVVATDVSHFCAVETKLFIVSFSPNQLCLRETR